MLARWAFDRPSHLLSLLFVHISRRLLMILNHMVNSKRQKKTNMTETKSAECVDEFRRPGERLDEEAATFHRVSRCWLRMSSAPSWHQWAEEQSLFVYWQLSNIITSMKEHLVKEEEATTWDLTLLGGREFCCSINTVLALRIAGLAIKIDQLGI